MRITPRPAYQQIMERLERDIRAGKYAAGQKFPSEAVLVKRFDVSRITVGRAVRELQQRGLLDRIAGSGTYVRGTEHQRRSGLLFGLVIPDLGETEIFEPICQGIAAAPDAAGHALLWAHAGQPPAGKHAGQRIASQPAGQPMAGKEEQAVELARQSIARGVAGIFFAPLEFSAASSQANARVMKLIDAARIPVVLLDRRPEESPGSRARDLVGIDNHRAAYIATEHLLRMGVRRAGFVRVEGHATTVKARVHGYQDALRDFGAHGHVYTMPPGERFVLPAAARGCEAFVCANDRVAGHLMHTLLAAGLRIPRDVRIVGIDDVAYAALLPVPLTTVHQPCRDIGEAALRVMLERLDRPRMPARDVLLECTLVVRKSCGMPLEVFEYDHVLKTPRKT